MAKITCEICGSTNILKDAGVFTCQDCGCKYSVEEIKAMMSNFNENNVQPNDIENNDQPEEYEQADNSSSANNEDQIPIHTADSPNKLHVEIIMLGHQEYVTWSDKPVFMAGPTSAGLIGAKVYIKNLKGKTIKYVTVNLAPFNTVDDQVSCNVRNYSVKGIIFTGPIEEGMQRYGSAQDIWYNNTIVYAKIHSVYCEYLDGTEELYEAHEFNNPTNINDARLHSNLTIKKYNYYPHEITCDLNGSTYVLPAYQDITFPVEHGSYVIKFKDFPGALFVPAKNKQTPEFVVNKNTTVQLEWDSLRGGFKSYIS